MSLPTSGSLSIKSAAGSDRCIACEVDGDESGNKNLTTLANSASFDLPVAITDFYGYPPANLSASPTSFSIGYEGKNSNKITVTSDVNWSANVTSGSSYVSITSGSTGSNDGSVYFDMSENTDKNNTRSATIVISDDDGNASDVTISITQDKALYKVGVEISVVNLSQSSDPYTFSADCLGSSYDWYVAAYKGSSLLDLSASLDGYDLYSGGSPDTKLVTLDITAGADLNDTITIRTEARTSSSLYSGSEGELVFYHDSEYDSVDGVDVVVNNNSATHNGCEVDFTYDTLNTYVSFDLNSLNEDDCL